MPISFAALTPVADHRPWPRYLVDEAFWQAIGAALGNGEGDLLGLWGEPGAVHLALRSPISMAMSLSAHPTRARGSIMERGGCARPSEHASPRLYAIRRLINFSR